LFIVCINNYAVDTFKQYMIQTEMGGMPDSSIMGRDGMINNNKARRMLKNTFLHADRLIRRRDRLPEDEVEMRAQELLRQFVDDYEKLGSEATELKAEIANKYTEIKGLLQSNNPLEDSVQIMEQLLDLLGG